MPSSLDSNFASRGRYYKTPRDPAGSGARGGSLALTGTTARTPAGIVADHLWILVVADASEAVVFLEFGDSAIDAAAESAPFATGVPYEIPWNSGDYLAGICLAGQSAKVYWAPVQ